MDGSLHVVLHPSDLARVVKYGWGEMHPIARADSWWCWWFFATERRPPAPPTVALLYAPQSITDIIHIMAIVQAGACFAGDETTKQTVADYDYWSSVRKMQARLGIQGDE